MPVVVDFPSGGFAYCAELGHLSVAPDYRDVLNAQWNEVVAPTG